MAADDTTADAALGRAVLRVTPSTFTEGYGSRTELVRTDTTLTDALTDDDRPVLLSSRIRGGARHAPALDVDLPARAERVPGGRTVLLITPTRVPRDRHVRAAREAFTLIDPSAHVDVVDGSWRVALDVAVDVVASATEGHHHVLIGSTLTAGRHAQALRLLRTARILDADRSRLWAQLRGFTRTALVRGDTDMRACEALLHAEARQRAVRSPDLAGEATPAVADAASGELALRLGGDELEVALALLDDGFAGSLDELAEVAAEVAALN